MKHLIKHSIKLLVLAVGILFSIHSAHAQYPYYQQSLLNERVGFGNTTGGAGGEVYWVTKTTDDYSYGTLRYALEGDPALYPNGGDPTPRWIMFAVSGTINLPNSPISVASNKTIDGRGASITITTYGFWIIGSRNIIVENLNISQGSNPVIDGIEITEGAGDVWVDHCSFSSLPDEAISVKEPRPPAFSDVTISWCRFIGSPSQDDKGILIGHAPGNVNGVYMRVTLHHNWFDAVNHRSPRIRRSLVHAFNNYLNDWEVYGMAATDKGHLRTQNNIFQPGGDTDAVVPHVNTQPPEDYGYTNNSGNWKISGATDPSYMASSVFNPADYYTYAHILETANSTLRSKIIASAGATRSGGVLANMSTRANVQGGQGNLISGFNISGSPSDSKRVIIRALGPSLSPWFPNAMGNPTLTVYNVYSQEIASNDNWTFSPQASEIQATGLAPSNDLEAAWVGYLSPGTYSAAINGWGTGIAVLEIYDLQASAPAKLVNISSRATVDPNNPPIAGFIAQSGWTKLIIRGIGPSLANYGIQNPISDPTLALHDANGTQIAYNNNWQDAPSGVSPIGFAPSDWREAVIVTNLAPGAYTAILRDYFNNWGIGLIELYKL